MGYVHQSSSFPGLYIFILPINDCIYCKQCLADMICYNGATMVERRSFEHIYLSSLEQRGGRTLAQSVGDRRFQLRRQLSLHALKEQSADRIGKARIGIHKHFQIRGVDA